MSASTRFLRRALVPLLSAPCLAAADFAVSPAGNDSGPGTSAAPFATAERAQKAVREVRSARPAEPVSVRFLPGVYQRDGTLNFTPADSGTEENPVVWSSLTPGAAVFSSARRIPGKRFQPVADPETLARLDPAARGKVMKLDLAAEGIRSTGPFADVFEDNNGLLTVFFEGAAMPLSRWPNGPRGYATLERVLDGGDTRARTTHGATVRYADSRPERWVKALEDGGVWVRGFWRVPWVIQGVKLKSIDPQAHTMTMAASVGGAVGSKYSRLENGTRIGDGTESWHALNLLEEIDRPGEWSVNFASKTLYFWPPASLEGREVLVADNRVPLIATRDASHLRFQGLTLAWHLGDGFSLQGGKDVSVAACDLHDLGQNGVKIRGGTGHGVLDSNLYDLGLGAVDSLGGNRQTLAPSGHRIVNNHIHHTGRNGPVPAVLLGYGVGAEAVGHLVAHNRVHDCPNSAFRYAGNDNILEFNEVYRVGLDSSDLGAFYTNSGWTSQGNILRFNFVHHSENAQGFYLDDGDCGDTVSGNVVYRVQSGVFLGGGHDNLVRNNIFISSDRGIHVDARGKSRGYTPADPRLGGDLARVPSGQPPWSARYPWLAVMTKSDTALPRGVALENNLAVGCKADVRRSATPAELAGVAFGALAQGTMDLFSDPGLLDFSVRDASRLDTLLPGFQPIPFGRIGLVTNENRTQLPPRDLEQLRNESTARRKFDSQVDVDASDRR